MFFVASKLVGLVAQPVNFLALLGLAGLVLQLTRFARRGRLIMSGAVALLAIACFSPLGAMLLRPLEDRFPSPPATIVPAPAGVLVLGGALDSDLGLARHDEALTEAAERLVSGVALARRYPEAKLVFTGGSADLRQRGADEAQGVRRLWRSLGVADERMIFESRSRNTFENATMTKALVQPQPGAQWLLVTSAAHMPRSVGIFRAAGWSVTPYPVDYRTYGDARDFKPNTIGIEGLKRIDVAFHEWVGLLAYWLTGRTKTLFPAPSTSL